MSNDSDESQPVIYATRPGLRVWSCDITGKVNATYMYKDLLGNAKPVELVAELSHTEVSSFSFSIACARYFDHRSRLT